MQSANMVLNALASVAQLIEQYAKRIVKLAEMQISAALRSQLNTVICKSYGLGRTSCEEQVFATMQQQIQT
jgi:hypothetical protein